MNKKENVVLILSLFLGFNLIKESKYAINSSREKDLCAAANIISKPVRYVNSKNYLALSALFVSLGYNEKPQG